MPRRAAGVVPQLGVEPIILKGSELHALHEGLLPLIVRPIKPQPPAHLNIGHYMNDINDKRKGVVFCRHEKDIEICAERWHAWCPYGAPGRILYVKEPGTLGHMMNHPDQPIVWTFDVPPAVVRHPDAEEGAEDWCLAWLKRSAAGMPRWAARLYLHLTSVAVNKDVSTGVYSWWLYFDVEKVIHDYRR